VGKAQGKEKSTHVIPPRKSTKLLLGLKIRAGAHPCAALQPGLTSASRFPAKKGALCNACAQPKRGHCATPVPSQKGGTVQRLCPAKKGALCNACAPAKKGALCNACAQPKRGHCATPVPSPVLQPSRLQGRIHHLPDWRLIGLWLAIAGHKQAMMYEMA